MRKLIANNPVLRFKISKKQSGGIMYTPGIYNKSTGRFTPNGLTYSDAREALKSTINVPKKSNSDLFPVYNRLYIRSQRDNYSDVNSYYDYITNNQDSNEAKLWNRVLGTLDTPEAKRLAFDLIMGAYGIKGNLGRRDSKRLSNVLNTIKGIATDNDTLNAYLKSYENAMANELIKRQPVQANIALSEAMKITPLRTPVKPTYNPDFRINTDLSGSNLFAKRGGVLKALKGMTFKQAFDKARAEGNRFFFYDDGTGIKTYNTLKKGEDKTVWAKNFKDNLTSGGADNVQTSINVGWSGKGASHGRYNSKGEYVKFNKASNAGPLAAKGDHINDNGDRGWGLADLPEEAVDLGRGTNRGKHTANVNTGVDIGDYVPTVLSGIMKLMPWQKVGNSKSPKNEIKIGNTTYKRGMLRSYPGYYNNQTGYFTRGNDIYLRSLKGGEYLDLKVGVIRNGEQYYSSDSDNVVTYDEYRKFLGADKNKFMGQDILKSNIVIPQEMPSFNDMRNKYNVTWHKNTHFKNFK